MWYQFTGNRRRWYCDTHVIEGHVVIIPVCRIWQDLNWICRGWQLWICQYRTRLLRLVKSMFFFPGNMLRVFFEWNKWRKYFNQTNIIHDIFYMYACFMGSVCVYCDISGPDRLGFIAADTCHAMLLVTGLNDLGRLTRTVGPYYVDYNTPNSYEYDISNICWCPQYSICNKYDIFIHIPYAKLVMEIADGG